MSKAEEIDTLTRFIMRLPHDSYLRPWLESVLPEVRADIRNDFPVSPSLVKARDEAAAIVKDAREEATRLTVNAQAQAASIVEQAKQDGQRIRYRLNTELRACIGQLGFSL